MLEGRYTCKTFGRRMDRQPGRWIYILFTSSDYKRCKIGMTKNNPVDRFKALRTGDPCLAFQVGYYIPDRFGPIASFEAAIHAEFEDERIETYEETKSEWFKIPPKQAELFVDCMLEDWTGQEVLMTTAFHCDHLIKMYEYDIQSSYALKSIDLIE